MPRGPSAPRDRRADLMQEIEHLAGAAIFGSASETYRTCGNPGCRCHTVGPKHGPHVYVRYREAGKTGGYYVPAAAQEDIRAGIEAWQTLQARLRELAVLNKERVLERARAKGTSG
jgi:hypothetical protein